ncbi:MAG TPA: GNVR domain-containing protein [Vicinamibacterales bacterium]|nr:GNVR domain-containing protein [Vicinamibacterales bacterium]
MEERSFHPLDYMALVRRRLWWFVVPLIVCVVAGALTVWAWPRKYLAQAQIAVAAPTLSPELLRGVSSLDKEERQRAISQELLSANVLQRVVREEKLSPEKPVESVVASLRANVERNIAVPQPIGKSIGSSRGLDSFVFGYTSSNPDLAARVTNRIANVFVEENSRNQTERAENTSEVLGQQLQKSQDALTRLENELRAKKEQYMGRLPDQVQANVQMVNGLRSQLESISRELSGEQDHLAIVESQLDQMRQGSAGAMLTTSGVATVQAAEKHIDHLQQEMAQDRALGYTDKHPDIVRLQHELTQARADLTAARRQNPADADSLLAADPQYHQLLQQRTNAELRIKDLQRASTQARTQIAQYQQRVEAAPMVEQELASLNRQYTVEKARFADLDTKHQRARMAEDLTRKQGGERFHVLYAAAVPDTPVEPQPLKIMALAIVAGLVLGAACALGREFLDRSVHDVRALQEEFEVPVLGEIPRIAA